jgi:DNA mismatch repair protein MutL
LPSVSTFPADRGPDRREVSSWFAPASPPPLKTPNFPNFAERPEPEWARALPPATGTVASADFDEFGPSVAAPATAAEPLADDPRATARELPGKAIQVHDTYLIAETDDGMVVIDQHALHERILYEELRQRVEQGGVESQRLLVPEPVDLSAEDAAEVLQRKETLARLGIGVEPFGGDTVLVTSSPVMLGHVPVDQLLRDLADHFRAMPVAPTADAILEDVLNMVACKAAVKANQRLTAEEIEALLARRHLASNTHHCPHGRPTALIFTKAELERQFGRI